MSTPYDHRFLNKTPIRWYSKSAKLLTETIESGRLLQQEWHKLLIVPPSITWMLWAQRPRIG
eukprot:4543685-Ditylum_brightwellii.AAC.1